MTDNIKSNPINRFVTQQGLQDAWENLPYDLERLGQNNRIEGQSSYGWGVGNKLTGNYHFTLGTFNTIAGKANKILGDQNYVLSDYSMIHGNKNIISATDANHVMIYGNKNQIELQLSSINPIVVFGHDNYVKRNNAYILGSNWHIDEEYDSDRSDGCVYIGNKGKTYKDDPARALLLTDETGEHILDIRQDHSIFYRVNSIIGTLQSNLPEYYFLAADSDAIELTPGIYLLTNIDCGEVLFSYTGVDFKNTKYYVFNHVGGGNKPEFYLAKKQIRFKPDTVSVEQKFTLYTLMLFE